VPAPLALALALIVIALFVGVGADPLRDPVSMPEAQFLEHPADVGGNGALGEVEFLSYATVCLATGDEGRHLLFAWGDGGAGGLPSPAGGFGAPGVGHGLLEAEGLPLRPKLREMPLAQTMGQGVGDKFATRVGMGVARCLSTFSVRTPLLHHIWRKPTPLTCTGYDYRGGMSDQGKNMSEYDGQNNGSSTAAIRGRRIPRVARRPSADGTSRSCW
jgi:hypothetical protein